MNMWILKVVSCGLAILIDGNVGTITRRTGGGLATCTAWTSCHFAAKTSADERNDGYTVMSEVKRKECDEAMSRMSKERGEKSFAAYKIETLSP
jgi:hypothetical protein